MPSEEHPELMEAAAKTFVVLRNVIAHLQRLHIMGAGDSYHRAMHCWMFVNGFTTLYAEGRLEWTGVTKDNATQALRILVKQYLIGAKSDLPLEIAKFKAFATPFASVHLQRMQQVEALFPFGSG